MNKTTISVGAAKLVSIILTLAGAVFCVPLPCACADAPSSLRPPLFIDVHDLGLAYGHFDRDVARLTHIAAVFHAKRVKIDSGWNVIEGQEGKYSFSNTDYMCSVAQAAHLKVELIVNNGWSVPSWLWRYKSQEPFALNADGRTGRHGQSLGSDIGRYPAPVLLAYSNPWVRARIRAWQGALARHVEKKFPGLICEYICEGEIYLNPDNDTGNLLFDYNPWTVGMFRRWLPGNAASPYDGAPSPASDSNAAGISLNRRWNTHYTDWAQVQPPRVMKANDAATRDWCAFLQWYVAWSYAQVASGLRAQTKIPITFLFNTFTGIPMPNDHVWGPSRTQDEYWLVFKMAAPYIDDLGVTAYPYDPGWALDASGQWDTSMAFLSTASRLLDRPVQIVEGGSTTMHPRTLADLRWQLFSAYSHDLAGIDIGYLDLPPGSFGNYSWNPALAFPETSALCRAYTSMPRPASVKAPPICVLYDSRGELLAPGNGTEARCVRAVGRELRDAHYRFDVLDTLALDEGDADLSAYRAVFLPCGVAVSARTRAALTRFYRAGGLLVLGDRAGSEDLFGNKAEPLYDALRAGPRLIRLDSATLSAQQAEAEQSGRDPDVPALWLAELGRIVRPILIANPSIDVSWRRPLIVFNRASEKTIRVTLPTGRSVLVPPGQEMPTPAPTVASPPAQPGVDLNRSADWSAFGAQPPLVTQGNDGLQVDFPAFQSSGVAETGIRAPAPDLSGADTMSMTLSAALAGNPTATLPPGTRLSLRLISTLTGRVYEVGLPCPTPQPTELTFDIGKQFHIPIGRRREIDRIAVVVSGIAWPRLQCTLSGLR